MAKGLGKGLADLFSEHEIEYGISPQQVEAAAKAKENKAVVSTYAEPAYSRQEPTAHKAQEQFAVPADGEVALQLPIHKVAANKEQPRKYFDPDSLRELTNSIRVHGVVQPIIVTQSEDGYMIIAGERRWRAAKDAGLTSIPAIVRKYTRREIKEISLIENLQREDLNPIEAAYAIKQLMEEHNFTQEAVADRIGKSRPAVANSLRLLSLTPEVIALVEKNRLSAGHARCLVVVTNVDMQVKLAKAACDNKMSVRDLEKAVKEYMEPKPQPEKKPEQSTELKDLIGTMQRVFATKVSALGNDRRGRIYIDYYSRDDLDRLVYMIKQLNKR